MGSTESSDLAVRIEWPEGKRFAFTVFDDTDSATVSNVPPVYDLLEDLGFRTTKSCWPLKGDPDLGHHMGQTLEDADYREWLLGLHARGFEIGWHNSTWHGVHRDQIQLAFNRFAEVFGHYPKTAANHSDGEAIYWGHYRMTGLNKVLYHILTRFRNMSKFTGHVPKSDFYWGDLCQEHLKYVRNFVFPDINSLKACPYFPYHDPDRPLVKYWFASSEGSEVRSYCRCISEANQDRLAEESGMCIMYTHFASGFCVDGKVDSEFQKLMTRLADLGGWFVPVATLLDYVLEQRGPITVTRRQRKHLERRWLKHKMRVGTT